MKRNRKPSPEMIWRLAANVKRLRKARGYSQKSLARRTGLPHGHISKIEQELMNTSLATLEALSNGLDCSLYDLFASVKTEPEQR